MWLLGSVRLRGHADAHFPPRAARRVPDRAARLLPPPRDALFELGDALLCAQAVPSLPHLSLEPVHRRGWGSVYAALARGRIDTERLRDLLVGVLPSADPAAPPVFAVDVTTWPRCDAECSPSRGYYYHPARHSAGQPIIVGWAHQWVCQLSFDRDSWTAPVDAQRLHPLDDLIDCSRTPVIGLRRTSWHRSEECLIAGGLTAMHVRVRDLPREVASLHSRVERYLKRQSQRLDPFETCHLYRGLRQNPSRSRGWWMWAMPQDRRS